MALFLISKQETDEQNLLNGHTIIILKDELKADLVPLTARSDFIPHDMKHAIDCLILANYCEPAVQWRITLRCSQRRKLCYLIINMLSQQWQSSGGTQKSSAGAMQSGGVRLTLQGEISTHDIYLLLVFIWKL